MYRQPRSGFTRIPFVETCRVKQDGREWVGLLCNVVGDLYYGLVLVNMENPPYPSVADVAYLSFYVCVYVAVLLILRSRITRWHASLWLDGLILSIGTAALGATFVLGQVISATGATTAEVLTNLAYPMGDLLLMSVVVAAVWMLRGHWDRSLLPLGIAIIFNTVGDTVYLVQSSAGLYVEGTALDLTWVLGSVAMAWAAATSRTP